MVFPGQGMNLPDRGKGFPGRVTSLPDQERILDDRQVDAVRVSRLALRRVVRFNPARLKQGIVNRIQTYGPILTSGN